MTYFSGNLSVISNPLEPTKMVFFFSLLTVFSILCALIWFLPVILVKIWLENFKIKCGYTSSDYFVNYRDCFNLYTNYEEVLKNFFIAFFGSSQILSIVIIFLSISSLLSEVPYSLDDLIIFAGLLSAFTGVIMSLTSLTEVVDSCFQALQGIRKEIQEKLLLCGEDKERQKLQYLLQRVEVLGPMSAGGYFEITKSSLISMLSVSLTYIIILVQFQLSNGDPVNKIIQQLNSTNATSG